jgi:hypothetical protein
MSTRLPAQPQPPLAAQAALVGAGEVVVMGVHWWQVIARQHAASPSSDGSSNTACRQPLH